MYCLLSSISIVVVSVLIVLIITKLGHEVPGVVAVLCEGMGGVGEVKYGLIAAAWSAFTC